MVQLTYAFLYLVGGSFEGVRDRERMKQARTGRYVHRGCHVASCGIHLGRMATQHEWSGCEGNTRKDLGRKKKKVIKEREIKRREGNGAKNETAPL